MRALILLIITSTYSMASIKPNTILKKIEMLVGTKKINTLLTLDSSHSKIIFQKNKLLEGHALVKIDRPFDLVKPILTDWNSLSKLIPLVLVSEFNKEGQTLEIVVGAFGYGIHSEIKITEDNGITHFKILKGDLSGLQGNLYLTNIKSETIIYMNFRYEGKINAPEKLLKLGSQASLNYSVTLLKLKLEESIK